MHVSDMIEQRKRMLQKEVISTKQPSHKAMIIVSIRYHLKLQLVIHTWVLIHPVMNYNINTNQSGPPMSARHKLQPRLLRSNPNTKPNTFPKKPARQNWTGPIHLPEHIYKLLSQEAKDALQKYNVELIQRFKASRNLNETELMHNVYEHAQKELPPSIDEEEFQEFQQFNTDQDLEPPTDDILEFITSQGHSEDQLDQVLQTYQAYQQSQSETETPPRQMNAHITYHVAQAKQAKHCSLVDRGQNGGYQVQMSEC